MKRLLMVPTAARFDALLNQAAVKVRERSAAWQKSGWNTFYLSSKPYGADEVLANEKVNRPASTRLAGHFYSTHSNAVKLAFLAFNASISALSFWLDSA